MNQLRTFKVILVFPFSQSQANLSSLLCTTSLGESTFDLRTVTSKPKLRIPFSSTSNSCGNLNSYIGREALAKLQTKVFNSKKIRYRLRRIQSRILEKTSHNLLLKRDTGKTEAILRDHSAEHNASSDVWSDDMSGLAPENLFTSDPCSDVLVEIDESDANKLKNQKTSSGNSSDPQLRGAGETTIGPIANFSDDSDCSSDSSDSSDSSSSYSSSDDGGTSSEADLSELETLPMRSTTPILRQIHSSPSKSGTTDQHTHQRDQRLASSRPPRTVPSLQTKVQHMNTMGRFSVTRSRTSISESSSSRSAAAGRGGSSNNKNSSSTNMVEVDPNSLFHPQSLRCAPARTRGGGLKHGGTLKGRGGRTAPNSQTVTRLRGPPGSYRGRRRVPPATRASTLPRRASNTSNPFACVSPQPSQPQEYPKGYIPHPRSSGGSILTAARRTRVRRTSNDTSTEAYAASLFMPPGSSSTSQTQISNPFGPAANSRVHRSERPDPFAIISDKSVDYIPSPMTAPLPGSSSSHYNPFFASFDPYAVPDVPIPFPGSLMSDLKCRSPAVSDENSNSLLAACKGSFFPRSVNLALHPPLNLNKSQATASLTTEKCEGRFSESFLELAADISADPNGGHQLGKGRNNTLSTHSQTSVLIDSVMALFGEN